MWDSEPLQYLFTQCFKFIRFIDYKENIERENEMNTRGPLFIFQNNNKYSSVYFPRQNIMKISFL